MASDLLSIAKSGTKAARIALDVTAQNIANASSEGYVRRTVRLEEVSAAGGIGRIGDVSLSGVRVDQVIRNADLFRQAEVRRTGADLSRADAEVSGLESIEAAIEQTGVFNSIVEFEGALQQLAVDPTDTALRASVVETTRTMTRTFNIAATSLDTAGQGIRFEATDDIDQVNLLAQELSRVNLRLARAADASSDQTSLLDQRDSLLQQLSERVDVSATFAADLTVDVRVGGTAGPLLVDGGTAGTMAMATAGDGTISFTLDGNPVTPLSGALVGRSQALVKLAGTRAELDAIADSIIATVNGAQATGAALDGSPGVAMLAGSGAAAIALAFDDGALLATAPSGAGANSRDPANLAVLRGALTDTALATFANTLIRARELAIQAGNDTLTASQRAAIGTELHQIHGHLVSLANARDSAGHALFGGETAGDAYAIDGTGNAVYLGTGSTGELSLGDGQSVTRGLTGPEVLSFDPGTGPTSTFAVIRDLALALGGASADPAQSARDSLGALSSALDAVTTNQTVVGTRLAWIDFVTDRHQDLGEMRAAEEADIGGTDIAATVARLQEAMLVLEASQASFARLAGLSLFNSLR